VNVGFGELFSIPELLFATAAETRWRVWIQDDGADVNAASIDGGGHSSATATFPAGSTAASALHEAELVADCCTVTSQQAQPASAVAAGRWTNSIGDLQELLQSWAPAKAHRCDQLYKIEVDSVEGAHQAFRARVVLLFDSENPSGVEGEGAANQRQMQWSDVWGAKKPARQEVCPGFQIEGSRAMIWCPFEFLDVPLPRFEFHDWCPSSNSMIGAPASNSIMWRPGMYSIGVSFPPMLWPHPRTRW
jgi:hypothetical protein